MFLFLVLINGAGFRTNLKNVGKYITKPFNRRGPMPKIHLKYIDDMTIAEALDLKKALTGNPDPEPERPLQYHERTGHVLQEAKSNVQDMLTELKAYTETHEMKLNTDKTKVILFNKSKKYDFLPQCYFDEGDNLEVVEEFKLLGLKIRSDLSWSSHCDEICQKGFARMWMLRRLKPLGANRSELLEIYQTQIRSVLEFAVAAWNSGLTIQQRNQIERVQKTAFSVILGLDYEHYTNALKLLNMDSLKTRRQALCLKFAKKALKHPKFSSWFCANDSTSITRSFKPDLKKPEALKRRFEKSPLFYLTNLLNDNK